MSVAQNILKAAASQAEATEAADEEAASTQAQLVKDLQATEASTPPKPAPNAGITINFNPLINGVKSAGSALDNAFNSARTAFDNAFEPLSNVDTSAAANRIPGPADNSIGPTPSPNQQYGSFRSNMVGKAYTAAGGSTNLGYGKPTPFGYVLQRTVRPF